MPAIIIIIIVKTICPIYILLLATSTLAKDNQRQILPNIPQRSAQDLRFDVYGSNTDECTSFKYTGDGQLHGCGYSLDIFGLTALHVQHASLISHLPQDHLNTLDQRALQNATFDIWSIDKISFAFETRTKRLFTAWGPKLRLRYLHSSNGFAIFENIHPSHPPYTHKCEPFCKLIQIGHTALSVKEQTHFNSPRFQGGMGSDSFALNESVYEMSDHVPSTLLASQLGSLKTLNITGCETCIFGKDVSSCDELLATCLNNQESCSRSRFSAQNDESSYFCKGLYYAYLKPRSASCPLTPTILEVYMYGICEYVKDELSMLLGRQKFEIRGNLSGPAPSYDLPTSERASDSRIYVHVSTRTNPKQKVINKIRKGLVKGDFTWSHIQYINYKKTRDSLECWEEGNGFGCSVKFYFTTIY